MKPEQVTFMTWLKYRDLKAIKIFRKQDKVMKQIYGTLGERLNHLAVNEAPSGIPCSNHGGPTI